jgi:hypothetical protein
MCDWYTLNSRIEGARRDEKKWRKRVSRYAQHRVRLGLTGDDVEHVHARDELARDIAENEMVVGAQLGPLPRLRSIPSLTETLTSLIRAPLTRTQHRSTFGRMPKTARNNPRQG